MEIFVVTGTNPYPFDRLLKWIDANIASRADVFCQLGSSNIKLKNARGQNYLTESKMFEKMKSADVVICHCGLGTVYECVSIGKPFIVVPRRIEYNECIDNQTELADYLNSQYSIASINDVSELTMELIASQYSKRILINNALPREFKDIIL